MSGEVESWALALLGGGLVGASSAFLLAREGVSEGVSGMAAGLVRGPRAARTRRALFLLGLSVAGGVYALFEPSAFADASGRPGWAFAVAGLAVGYGARLANGCTSGHGVLGVSRGRARSIVAVFLFALGATCVEQFFPSRDTAESTRPRAALAALCSAPTPCSPD